MASINVIRDSLYLVFSDSTRKPTRKKVPMHLDASLRDSPRAKDRRVVEDRKTLIESLYEEGHFDPWISTDWQAVLEHRESTPSYLSISEAGKRFIEHRERTLSTDHDGKQRGVRVYKQQVHALRDFVGPDTLVHNVRPDDICAYLDTCNIKPVSFDIYVDRLSVFFNFCKNPPGSRKGGLGIRMDNPCEGVPLPPVPDKDPEFFRNASEVEAFIEQVRIWLKNPAVTRGNPSWIIPVVRCNVQLGLRAAELTNLIWDEVHFKDDGLGGTPPHHVRKVQFISDRPLQLFHRDHPARPLPATEARYGLRLPHLTRGRKDVLSVPLPSLQEVRQEDDRHVIEGEDYTDELPQHPAHGSNVVDPGRGKSLLRAAGPWTLLPECHREVHTHGPGTVRNRRSADYG